MKDIERILENLSEVQRRAVTHRDGPLLVIAGAGSGKTRVITHRVAYLIATGVAPENILAITFTNKAANEMKERIERFCPEGGPWVSTFHSFCARILRSEADLIGYGGNFSIYDEDESLNCLKSALAELKLDPLTYLQSAAAEISRAKNNLVSPDEYAERFSRHQSVFADVYRLYQELLRSNNAMDFDDLLCNVVRLFSEYPEVLEEYQQRFRYILIDEYQDTNHAQYVIAKLLAQQHRNICATGDPDQSIYTWRGADLRNILEFEREYPDATVIKLEENYRSTGNILNAASELIRHNVLRKEKTLWTRAGEGEAVKLIICANSEGEAEAVVEEIQRALNEGFEPRDVVVLFRINAQSRSFEAALRNRAIPYQIVGGVEFFRRKEVKDIVAYLRVVVNPSDDVAMRRILNVPPRGIGDKTVERLSEVREGKGVSLFEAASLCAANGSIRGKALDGLKGLIGIIEGLKKMRNAPVARIVGTAVEKTGYMEYLKKGGAAAEDRVANVEELVTAAAEYDRQNPDGSLEGFLEQVALVSDVDTWDDRSNRVTLMTLHSVKGLEFPIVFLTGLEEGLLPHSRSSDSDEEIEEERRLCYVGMTRAMKRLILTYARSRVRFGIASPSVPSRFLKELPTSRFEQIDLSRKAETVGKWDEGGGWVAPDWHDFRPGDFVEHETYGEGVIVAVEGYGKTRRARIKFDNGAVKTFVLSIAKLRKK